MNMLIRSPRGLAQHARRSLPRRLREPLAALALASPLAVSAQIANSEALGDLISKAGGAGFGALIISERSPYRGEGQRPDVLPVYLYEVERFFLRSDRVGLKLAPAKDQALDGYLRRRIEGFPPDHVPPILQGLSFRNGG